MPFLETILRDNWRAKLENVGESTLKCFTTADRCMHATMYALCKVHTLCDCLAEF